MNDQDRHLYAADLGSGIELVLHEIVRINATKEEERKPGSPRDAVLGVNSRKLPLATSDCKESNALNNMRPPAETFVSRSTATVDPRDMPWIKICDTGMPKVSTKYL